MDELDDQSADDDGEYHDGHFENGPLGGSVDFNLILFHITAVICVLLEFSYSSSLSFCG